MPDEEPWRLPKVYVYIGCTLVLLSRIYSREMQKYSEHVHIANDKVPPV